MCGRYSVFTEQDMAEMRAILAEIEKNFGPDSVKTGEIFPTNTAVILKLEESRMTPWPVKWGFPRWDGGGAVINARAETALEKNMFRKPLLTRRCVIPSTGFYEWKRVDGVKKKDKYLLRIPESNMLYMAGMTNLFKDPSGTPYEAFVILTTAANESVSPIHNRMPVILRPHELNGWLTFDGIVEDVLRREGPELEMMPAV